MVGASHPEAPAQRPGLGAGEAFETMVEVGLKQDEEVTPGGELRDQDK